MVHCSRMLRRAYLLLASTWLVATLFLVLLALRCVACHAEGPSQVEVRTALAAVEQWLTTPVTLEVTYRRHYAWVPGAEIPGQPLLPDSLTEWAFTPHRTYYAERQPDPPGRYFFQAIFDGHCTTEWNYDDEGAVHDIWRFPGRLRELTRNRNELAYSMGLYAWNMESGILSHIEQALGAIQAIPARHNDGGMEIELPRWDQTTEPAYVLTIDPHFGHRLSGWRLGSLSDASDASRAIRHDVIEEYQLLTDESSGADFWFPKRVRREDALVVVTTDVVSARINHEIPDSRFEIPRPPSGTPVYEEPKTHGSEPRRSVVGGERANEQRIADMAKLAQRERFQLQQTGVTFDGTPAHQSYGMYCLFVAVLLLVAAVYLHFVARR
jgi:hypothetical protein